MRGATYPEDRAVPAVVSRLNAIAEYRRLFARRVRRRAGPSTNATSGARSRRFSGRSWPPTRRSTATCAATRRRSSRRAGSRHGAVSSRSGCINCHSGPMFSDFATHVLAVPDNPKLPESDSGVNKTYAFRTPSLRNLGVTAPYMHNGAFATLQEVVDFYQRISRGGGRRRRWTRRRRGLNPQVSRDQIDPLARQLNMRGRVSATSSRSCARWTIRTSIARSPNVCRAGCRSADGWSRPQRAR